MNAKLSQALRQHYAQALEKRRASLPDTLSEAEVREILEANLRAMLTADKERLQQKTLRYFDNLEKEKLELTKKLDSGFVELQTKRIRAKLAAKAVKP